MLFALACLMASLTPFAVGVPLASSLPDWGSSMPSLMVLPSQPAVQAVASTTIRAAPITAAKRFAIALWFLLTVVSSSAATAACWNERAAVGEESYRVTPQSLLVRGIGSIWPPLGPCP